MKSSKTKTLWLFCLMIFLLLGVPATPPTWAQSNDILANNQIYDLISQGYVMNVTAREISYQHLALGESPFFKRQVMSAKLAIHLIKPKNPSYDFEQTIELQPGERIVDHLPVPDASFIFYNDDQGLSSTFAQITSEETKLDTQGRPSYILLKGTWIENPAIQASLERNDFKYDSRHNSYAYFLRVVVLTGVSGFPGGNVNAYQIRNVILNPNTKKVSSVIYNYFYGPSNLWYLYNIRYDKGGEVVGCSLFQQP